MSGVPTPIISPSSPQAHIQQPPAVSAATTSAVRGPSHPAGNSFTAETATYSNHTVNLPVIGAAGPVQTGPCLVSASVPVSEAGFAYTNMVTSVTTTVSMAAPSNQPMLAKWPPTWHTMAGQLAARPVPLLGLWPPGVSPGFLPGPIPAKLL
jgi:hypothetical protein